MYLLLVPADNLQQALAGAASLRPVVGWQRDLLRLRSSLRRELEATVGSIFSENSVGVRTLFLVKLVKTVVFTL